jgi:quercetin dioxygenase-like cupin family protein
MATIAQPINIETQPKAVKSGEGLKIELPGETMTIKVSAAESGGAFSVAELQAEPNVGPPMHMHALEDELFLIHDGSVEFRVANETIVAEAGTRVWAPRNIPHTYKTLTNTRFTVISTGSNFEEFFFKYGQAMGAGEFDRAAAIAAEHGISFVEA